MPGALRLSFAGLEPEQIRDGLAILGRIVADEIAHRFARRRAFVGNGMKELWAADERR